MTKSIREKISKALKGKLPKNFYEMQKIGWQNPHKSNKSSFKKGVHYSVETEFKKGQYENEKNFHWKGEKVSYSGLHHWVKRKLGSPKECFECGNVNNIQWANKDHKYKRNLIDWLSLCARCHKEYDKNLKINSNICL